MPMNIILMCSNMLSMSHVDAGFSLRRHFDSTCDPEPQNLSQVVWVYLSLFEAATVCQWILYQSAQTLVICLIWMPEASLTWL